MRAVRSREDDEADAALRSLACSTCASLMDPLESGMAAGRGAMGEIPRRFGSFPSKMDATYASRTYRPHLHPHHPPPSPPRAPIAADATEWPSRAALRPAVSQSAPTSSHSGQSRSSARRFTYMLSPRRVTRVPLSPLTHHITIQPPDLACISAKHRRLCLSPRQITQVSPSSTQPSSCRHSVTTEQLHRLPRRLSGCSASKQPAQVTQANRKQPFPKHLPFQPKWLPQHSSSRGPVFFAFKQT